LAAAPCASRARRQLCLRQSRDRGDAGRRAGARKVLRARAGGHGRDPAWRGRHHHGQGREEEGMNEARADKGIDRQGLWMAIGAFVIWGVMPLYWHLLKAVPSLQIIAHRIVWSTVL